MYDVIENLYFEFFPEEPLPPVTAFIHPLDRRSLAIKKVVERIKEESSCTNAPPGGLGIRVGPSFNNAGATARFDGSAIKEWRLYLPPEWWIEPDELVISDSGKVVAVSELVQSWLPTDIQLPTKAQGQKLLFNRAHPQHAADEVYYIVRHELGHLQCGHAVAEPVYREHIETAFYWVIGAICVGGLVGVFLLAEPSIGTSLSGSSAIGIALGLIGFGVTSIALMRYGLHQRKEWEADLFATQSPRAIQGAIWRYRQEYHAQQAELGYGLYEWVELLSMWTDTHPTARQRLDFFARAAASMNDRMQSSDYIELQVLDPLTRG
jgi:hypothetical protein